MNAAETVKKYLAEIEEIDRAKNRSSFDEPESQVEAEKIAQKPPESLDSALLSRLYAGILRKRGFVALWKKIPEEHFSALCEALKASVSSLGTKKEGMSTALELRLIFAYAGPWEALPVGLLTRPDFLERLDFLLTVRRFSNLPNLLKKASAITSFSQRPGLPEAMFAALQGAPYLGLEPAGKHYFVPSDFQHYWAMWLVLLAEGKKEALSRLKEIAASRELVKNRAEFDETRERVRHALPER